MYIHTNHVDSFSFNSYTQIKSMQKLQGHKELRKFYTTYIKMDKWMAHLEMTPAPGHRRWIELGQI